MSDPLNGLKPQVQRAPFSLEMVTLLVALVEPLPLLLPPPLPALQRGREEADRDEGPDCLEASHD